MLAQTLGTVLIDKALSGIIGGVIGGFLGVGFRWLDQRAERRRRRRAVATALLDDLRSLELDMRELVTVDFAAQVASLKVTRAGQVFRRIGNTDDLYLFRASTVSRILYLVTLVTRIDEFGALYLTVSEPLHPRLHHSVRAKAWFLATLAPVLRDCLLREGGTLPPKEPVPILEGFRLPELGPLAFPEWTVPPPPPAGKGVWVDAAGRPAKDQPASDGTSPDK